MRKADLERALEAVPKHPAPKPELEQYRTPAGIAADLLLLAHGDGAIAGKSVLDLGCGTGTFAIGAALLGARMATGVDVDAQAVALAQRAAQAAGVATRTWFVTADLAGWKAEPGVDTVVMNPPFGAQRENRHADRIFYERAVAAVKPAGTVWFLAQERTERFLQTMAQGAGAQLERITSWDYQLEATMPFHKAEAQAVRVGGYRLGWSV